MNDPSASRLLPEPAAFTVLPLTTVVIPARNAGGTLSACLDALEQQGIPGAGVRLIVVDDASTDDTRAVAGRPGIEVLPGPGTGPAAARNVGARGASGDVLVFLDADTVPEPRWLREMLAPLADRSVVAVKGRYRTVQRSLLARFTQLEFEWKYARLERAARVDYVDTGTAAYRRQALLDAGAFDEGLRTSEDVELSYRLAQSGAQLVFNPQAVVLHRHTEELTPYFFKKMRGAYTRTKVYQRFPRKTMGDSYTPPAMGLQIALVGALCVLSLTRLLALPGAHTAWRAAWIAYGATTFPLVKRALQCDPGVAPAVPALVFIRSLAQGIGIAGALAARLIDRVAAPSGGTAGTAAVRS